MPGKILRLLAMSMFYGFLSKQWRRLSLLFAACSPLVQLLKLCPDNGLLLVTEANEH